MTMEKISVIVKEPGQSAEIREIEADWRNIQKVVGGYFTAVGFLWPKTFIIMDEEADYKESLDNIKAPPTILTKNHTFKGTLFVCAESRGKYVSLPQKYVQKTIDYLNQNAV